MLRGAPYQLTADELRKTNTEKNARNETKKKRNVMQDPQSLPQAQSDVNECSQHRSGNHDCVRLHSTPAENLRSTSTALLPLISQAIRGISAPLEAWAVLEEPGFLPDDFISSDRRSYAEGISIRSNDRPQVHARPTSIQSIMTIASDLGGVCAAESYARELARALTPWTASCNDRVVWHFMDRPIDRVVFLGLAYNSARDTVIWTPDEYGVDLGSLQPTKEVCSLPLIVRYCLAAWQGWKLAAEKGFEIQRPKWPLDITKWQSFRQLANPFESLLKLWCTGYLIYRDFDETDPTIRLYAQHISLPAAGQKTHRGD